MKTQPATTGTSPVVNISGWDRKVTRTYEANRNGLMAAAGRICGPDHAADIAQDAFIRVWSNPQVFDEARGTLTRYLFVVTRGVSIDKLRAATSQRVRDTTDIARAITTSDEPSARLISVERYDRMRAAVAALRPAEREVIEAAFFRHLTYREVAVSLNLPEGTVKSRIRLALVRMRRDISSFDETTPLRKTVPSLD